MNIIRCKDYAEMSRAAANIVETEMAAKKDFVLGLATGSTPEGMYAILAEDCKAGKVDFSNVTTINLDEYCGLEPTHNQSYRYFMNEKLFNHVNVDINRTFVPQGNTDNHEAAAANYEAMIRELGYADVQILGVGRNGHIAFNEPAERLFTETHMTALTKDTIRANARFFDSIDEVPTRAITMGMGSIMAARHIVIMANGEGKKNAVAAMIGGVIDTMYPASLLQLHPNVTLICDEAAWPGN